MLISAISTQLQGLAMYQNRLATGSVRRRVLSAEAYLLVEENWTSIITRT